MDPQGILVGVRTQGRLMLAFYKCCEMRAWWAHDRSCWMEKLLGV